MSDQLASTTAEIPPAPKTGAPSRSRAVFSTADFALLRTAVLAHLRQIEDTPESVAFANLYHRLGRIG